MSYDRSDFYSYDILDEVRTINFSGSQTGTGVGFGSIEIRTYVDGYRRTITLEEVLHVPQLREKLFFIGAATTRHNSQIC